MLVTQLCLTLWDPMDCSPPGSSIHEIFQAGILEWVAISFSRGSSWPRDWTVVSCTAGRFFIDWATRETTYRKFFKINKKQIPHKRIVKSKSSMLIIRKYKFWIDIREVVLRLSHIIIVRFSILKRNYS